MDLLIQNYITKLTSDITSPFDSMVATKTGILITQNAIDRLESELAKLRHLQSLYKISLSTESKSARRSILSISDHLKIPKHIPEPPAKIVVTIAPNVNIVMPLVKLEQLQPMRYAAVIINRKPTIVYKYSSTSIVSCGGLRASTGENKAQSMACTNYPGCTYGNECRYYHDPVLWADSNHMQQISRNILIRLYPFFGDTASLADQIRGIDFEQLRTLARYIATINLIISRIANK